MTQKTSSRILYGPGGKQSDLFLVGTVLGCLFG